MSESISDLGQDSEHYSARNILGLGMIAAGAIVAVGFGAVLEWGLNPLPVLDGPATVGAVLIGVGVCVMPRSTEQK
jgi:hypothetical protein